jgi:hypothetical protein
MVSVSFSSLVKVTFALSSIAEAIMSTNAKSQETFIDSYGIEFDSSESFCRYHCKSSHLFRAKKYVSECTEAKCASYISRRLNNNTEIQTVDFMTCKGVSSSINKLNFQIDQNTDTSIFKSFHDTFFAAYDAMITSANATYDACQLEFLQEKFALDAPTVTSGKDDAAVKKPSLIKLKNSFNQRECIKSLRTIWTEDDAFAPFISRSDQSKSSWTILLVHLSNQSAIRINALDCIESVTNLPSILKLMPFARAAYQLGLKATKEAPALEIRFVKGSNQREITQRLQASVTQLHGIKNAFELPEDTKRYPRTAFLRNLHNVESWSHAVSVILNDNMVEWVDLKTELSQNVLRGTQQFPPLSRRLDDYVEDLVGVKAAQDKGITGNDVIIGITDSGLYIDHDQFDQSSRKMYEELDLEARKVVLYNAWANKYDESEEVTCGHGTHVAGILAGSSNSGESSNIGIAWKSRIAFMDIGLQSSMCTGTAGCPVKLSTPGEARELLNSQVEAGARIFSFSWGTPGSDYSVQARDLDDYIFQNPETLIIVAAGNSGESGNRGMNTISSPSGAKNVISVGASLNAASSFTEFPCPNVFNEYTVAAFSSAGPTTDGRMKPDVVAPGMLLTSAQSQRPGSTEKTDATCSLQGTSQSTPVVAGIAVLLYEWLRDGWWKQGTKNVEQYGMKYIPAALLKALIIHSGEGLQRRLAPLPSGPVSCGSIERDSWSLEYPDMYQGYGKPNMSNIADFSTASEIYFVPNSTEGSEPRVAHQEQVVFVYVIPQGVDLRATLVWSDPAGSIRSTSMLQHDLDLSIRPANGSKVFYPLTADKTSNRDEKNNVEMIQVAYKDLFEAAKSENLVSEDGSIIVEAIVYGYSVLSTEYQSFAFVASSSVIGAASGFSKRGEESSFWTPWTIAGILAGILVLLLVIALAVRHCSSRTNFGFPGAGPTTYQPHSTPGGQVPPLGPRADLCPYCDFSHPDPVVMVNHVENVHFNGVRGIELPPQTLANGREQCPYCAFRTSDAVILVNHVENAHGR